MPELPDPLPLRPAETLGLDRAAFTHWRNTSTATLHYRVEWFIGDEDCRRNGVIVAIADPNE